MAAPEPVPRLGTLSELIDSPNACSPQRWAEKRDALEGQKHRALTRAAQMLEPKPKVQPVTPPRHILRSEADLNAWLAEVCETAKLANGPVQV